MLEELIDFTRDDFATHEGRVMKFTAVITRQVGFPRVWTYTGTPAQAIVEIAKKYTKRTALQENAAATYSALVFIAEMENEYFTLHAEPIGD